MLENNLRWKTKLWETMRGNIGISIRATAVGPSERAGAHSESSQDYHRCLELHPMLSLFLWIGENFSSALHSVSCHCGCHLRKVFEFCSSCFCIGTLACGHPWVAVYVGLSAGSLVYGVGGYCPCEGSDILVLSLQQRMLSLNILSILSAPTKIICFCNAMVQKYR